MTISVQRHDFDPARETALLTAGRTDIGALVTFTGLVRDMAGKASLSHMTLEHYPGMTERMLSRIEGDALARWPLSASRIVHRHGRLAAGERIVFVATASAHRQAAFEACAFLVDWLKTSAPFWKLEEGENGPAWVAARAADDAATARWAKNPPGS